MTDENTTVETTSTEPTETVEALTAKVEHWKSMARKNEDRAKENAAAAEKLAGVEKELAEAKAVVEGAPVKVAESLRDSLVSLGVVSEEDKVLLTGASPESLIEQVKRLTARSGDKKDDGNRAPLQGLTSDKKATDPLRELARGLFPQAN